jgi:hypothetical protein
METRSQKLEDAIDKVILDSGLSIQQAADTLDLMAVRYRDLADNEE